MDGPSLTVIVNSTGSPGQPSTKKGVIVYTTVPVVPEFKVRI